MIKHADSHTDHGLTDAQLAYLLTLFADRTAFFIETITLPEDLGTVPCGLYGPAVGDSPVVPAVGSLAYVTVREGDTVITKSGTLTHEPRNGRAWASRLIELPARPTRLVTVIAGPHDGHPCVLFTAFGGPLAPQEPDDPGCKDVAASRAFWAEHALAK